MRAFVAVVGVTRRQVETTARVVGFAALGVVAVAVAWRVGVAEVADPDRAAVRFADRFSLAVVAPLVALVFGAAAFGDGREDGTLLYLWARPRRRSVLAGGAFVATLVPVLPLAVVPAAATAALVGADGVTVAWIAAVAAAVAVAHAAVFVLLGLVTGRALLWGIAYVLVVEQFVARGGESLAATSLHAHGVSILAAGAGQDLPLAWFSPTTSWTVLAAVTVVAVVATARRLAATDLT